MLTLSRLVLNVQSETARRDLLDPYQMHRTLQRAFAGPRAEAGMLYRLELDTSEAVVLAQSRAQPDWSALPEGYLDADAPVQTRQWSPALALAGDAASPLVLRFRLRANPTYKRGRRRLGWLRVEQQLGWLARQGERHGFAVLQALAMPEGLRQFAGQRRATPPITCCCVLFDGFVSVHGGARLAAAVEHGLGSGKAFGCGLLSLAVPDSGVVAPAPGE